MLIFGKSIVSSYCFRFGVTIYIVTLSCWTELHRFMLLLFVFPSLSKNFANLRWLWWCQGLEPPAWPLTTHLFYYLCKNFLLPFCYPFFAKGVQRYRLLSTPQNCFWFYFQKLCRTLAILTSKELLFPPIIPGHPPFFSFWERKDRYHLHSAKCIYSYFRLTGHF
jgi:hypothetical protein